MQAYSQGRPSPEANDT